MAPRHSRVISHQIQLNLFVKRNKETGKKELHVKGSHLFFFLIEKVKKRKGSPNFISFFLIEREKGNEKKEQKYHPYTCMYLHIHCIRKRFKCPKQTWLDQTFTIWKYLTNSLKITTLSHLYFHFRIFETALQMHIYIPKTSKVYKDIIKIRNLLLIIYIIS